MVALILYCLLSVGLAYRLGYFKLPEVPRMVPNVTFGHLIAAFALVLMIAPMVVSLLLALFIGLQHGFPVQTELFASYTPYLNPALAALQLLFLLYLLRRTGEQLIGNVFSPGQVRLVRALVFGVASWALAYPIVMLASQVVHLILEQFKEVGPVQQTVVRQVKETASNPWILYSNFLTISLIVPVTEEVLFRGLLQSWMRQVTTQKKAILYSGIVFAIAHFTLDQGVGNLEIITGLFVLSLFLGFVYERQKTLWAPIALHIAVNTISLVALTLFK